MPGWSLKQKNSPTTNKMLLFQEKLGQEGAKGASEWRHGEGLRVCTNVPVKLFSQCLGRWMTLRVKTGPGKGTYKDTKICCLSSPRLSGNEHSDIWSFLGYWGFCTGADDYRHIRPLHWGSDHFQTTGPLGSGLVSNHDSFISSNHECAKCLDRGGHIWGYSWDQ